MLRASGRGYGVSHRALSVSLCVDSTIVGCYWPSLVVGGQACMQVVRREGQVCIAQAPVRSQYRVCIR